MGDKHPAARAGLGSFAAGCLARRRQPPRPVPSQRKAAQRAAGVNADARVAELRAVVDVVRRRKAGTPVARSEKRLTTGGRSAWPAAPGPGGRLGLEDGLNSGGEELCGLCVDGDAPAEQHAANNAAGVRGRIVQADGGGAGTGGIGLPGHRRTVRETVLARLLDTPALQTFCDSRRAAPARSGPPPLIMSFIDHYRTALPASRARRGPCAGATTFGPCRRDVRPYAGSSTPCSLKLRLRGDRGSWTEPSAGETRGREERLRGRAAERLNGDP